MLPQRKQTGARDALYVPSLAPVSLACFEKPDRSFGLSTLPECWKEVMTLKQGRKRDQENTASYIDIHQSYSDAGNTNRIFDELP
jgi:hypothetical protein